MAIERDALTGSLQRFGLERDRLRAALARKARVSSRDLDALEHLEADGPLTQRELGDRLSLTSGAVTMLVDRLEGAGLVHRRKHPTDRRYLLIELSSHALESVPAELVEYHAAIRRLTEAVAVEHRSVVSEFLREAAAAAARAAADTR